MLIFVLLSQVDSDDDDDDLDLDDDDDVNDAASD